jgi:hypothetical protein
MKLQGKDGRRGQQHADHKAGAISEVAAIERSARRCEGDGVAAARRSQLLL